MSRFTAPQLAALPEIKVLKVLNFEEELFDLKSDFQARAENHGLDMAEVLNLEATPLNLAFETFAARIVRLYGEINDDIRKLLLTDAEGAALDHIALTYYGIGRLVISPADPDAVPPKEAVMESDDDFRDRISLAPEGFSTAGPIGAYLFHMLELDGVKDIADVEAFSDDEGATYTAGLYADAYTAGARSTPFAGRETGDPVADGEVLGVILPTRAYGLCDQALLDRTYAALSKTDIRPMNDKFRVEPASLNEYQIEATLFYEPGADTDAMLADAQAAALAHRDERRRIGARLQRIGLAAALKVNGVQELELAKPAADILPGSKGYADCLSDPVITLRPLDAGWRP